MPWRGGAERGYFRNVLWGGVRGQALTRDANTYRIPPNGKSTWWNHGVLTANGQADHIGWLRSAAGQEPAEPMDGSVKPRNTTSH